jgi:hypothetical protein
MRVAKFVSTGLIAIGLLGVSVGDGCAEPVKIRAAWTVPVANWASLLLQKDLGFLKAGFDVKAHSDLGIVEEAAKRLQ